MKKIVISLLIVAFAITANAQQAEQLIRQAISLRKAGNYTGAIALLCKNESIFAKEKELSGMYGQLSWYYLFTRDFNLAEQAVRKSLKIDSTQTWVKTNLAHALLFEGKTAEAEIIYTELANTIYYNEDTYAATLLDDFEQFDKANIVPPKSKNDFEMIRTNLNKTNEAIKTFKQFEQLCIAGKFDDAIVILHPCISFLPQQHAQWVVKILLERGNEYYKSGDYANSEKYLLEAKIVREQMLKKDHPAQLSFVKYNENLYQK